jgi:arylsulfatase A-like enzyme
LKRETSRKFVKERILRDNITRLIACITILVFANTTQAVEKPNILVIWGDDIGIDNVSVYNLGMMGYQTPNIDRLAKEGALFTDVYAEQTCTAGRSAFILGQSPFRTGLLTIGMPGSDHGMPDWAPTIGEVLKHEGYATAQFGKNHLGDQDKHLPTNHGFDEFFGNLYHLNAEEEPETYYYPKDPEFHKKFGPRGVIRASADGKIEDTGPLTRKRMETADEEFLAAALQFMDKARKNNKPFFIWFSATRMHVWTHLKPEYQGITGIGLYPDGMVEHDDHVGILLDKLDELGIADNTIVMYSTDNGAEPWTWPDGGQTRFRGSKSTNWEGGHRVPLVVRWPGTIKPGTIYNDVISHMDWLPTFAAAAGEPDLVEKLKKGARLNGKKFKVHLDGHNFLPYFSGKADKGPRNEYLYWGMDGTLNAVRWGDFKAHFNYQVGSANPFSGAHMVTPNAPMIFNLRADPFERAQTDSGAWETFAIDQMWLFVPLQGAIGKFLATIPDYPFQTGSSLSASNINYDLLRRTDAMQKLKKLQDKVELLGTGAN